MILTILSSISFANADLEQGKSALQSKNYQQAQESLNLCLSKEPNNEDCLWEIGWAYWMMSQWDEVVKKLTNLPEEEFAEKVCIDWMDRRKQLGETLDEKEDPVSGNDTPVDCFPKG